MNDLNWNVDELVAKIMEDLRSEKRESTPKQVGATLEKDFASLHSKESSASDDETESSEAYVVSEKILVVDVVRKLAQSTSSKRWIAQRGAVITPAARDELKKLGVELEETCGAERDVARTVKKTRTTISASNVSRETFATAESVPAKSGVNGGQSSVRVLLAVHADESERLPDFIQETTLRSAETLVFRSDCLRKISARIAEERKKDEALKTIVVTSDDAIASIWINRYGGSRAVVVRSVEKTIDDCNRANANVVIVDPKEIGAFRYARIIDHFLSR